MGAILRVKDKEGNVYPIPAIKGEKGDSPKVDVSKTDKTTTITVTNADGTVADPVTIVDGEDGGTPTIDVSKTDGVTTITVTNADGSTTTEKIDDGEDGISPTIDVSEKVDGVTTVTITNADGTEQTAVIKDGIGTLPLVATVMVDGYGEAPIPEFLTTEGSAGYLVTYTQDNELYESGLLYFNPVVSKARVSLSSGSDHGPVYSLTIDTDSENAKIAVSGSQIMRYGIVRFYGPIEITNDNVVADQDLITFTVASVSYISPAGLTWAEWMSTTANIHGFALEDVEIADNVIGTTVCTEKKDFGIGVTGYTIVVKETKDSDGNVTSITPVTPDDKIEADYSYAVRQTPFIFYINDVPHLADMNVTWSEWLGTRWNTDAGHNYEGFGNAEICLYESEDESTITILTEPDGDTAIYLNDKVIPNYEYSSKTVPLTTDASLYREFSIGTLDFRVSYADGTTWKDWVSTCGKTLPFSIIKVRINGKTYDAITRTGTLIDGTTYVLAYEDDDKNVVIVKSSDEIIHGQNYFETPVDQVIKSFLTFTSPTSFSLRVLKEDGDNAYWDGTVEYSVDKHSWTIWDGAEITADINGISYDLYLRGTGNTVITGQPYVDIPAGRWVLDGSDINCLGNIENLLDYNTVAEGLHPTMGEKCFYNMFRECTSLTAAPDLPSMTLADYCYMYMFYGCTSLATAPELPAMVLTKSCYNSMFQGCTSLTKTPELPATTLASSCYKSMFMGCKNLAELPELLATTLPGDCYYRMFYNCSAIQLTETQTWVYHEEYRIPPSYKGLGKETGENTAYTMFYGTGGTFTGTPNMNRTYYTRNPVVTSDTITFTIYLGCYAGDDANGNGLLDDDEYTYTSPVICYAKAGMTWSDWCHSAYNGYITYPSGDTHFAYISDYEYGNVWISSNNCVVATNSKLNTLRYGVAKDDKIVANGSYGLWGK